MAAKPTWPILLIDAQPMSRKSLKSQLEYYQYAVLEASTPCSKPTRPASACKSSTNADAAWSKGGSMLFFSRA